MQQKFRDELTLYDQVANGIGILLLTPVLIIWNRNILKDLWEDFLEK